MNYKNIQISKNMYGLSKKNFNQILEELDPSENYVGTGLEKLDAFQRQLKRFNIKVKGMNCDCVNKFFESEQSSALFPEFLARAVKNGMESNNILKHIIANTIKIDSLTYHNVLIDDFLKTKLDVVNENGSFNETQLKTNENAVKLIKRGRILTTTYETIEFEKINSFTVALKQIGRCLCDLIVKDALDVLVGGENKQNSSKELFTQKENELSFNDVFSVWCEFQEFELNTIVLHPSVLIKILQIPEFKNLSTASNFEENGIIATPFGAKIVKTYMAPRNKIIFLDRNFALNQVVAKDVTMEADRLIDKQLERSTIFTISGFTKLFKNACFILSLNKN